MSESLQIRKVLLEKLLWRKVLRGIRRSIRELDFDIADNGNAMAAVTFKDGSFKRFRLVGDMFVDELTIGD